MLSTPPLRNRIGWVFLFIYFSSCLPAASSNKPLATSRIPQSLKDKLVIMLAMFQAET